MEKTVNAPNMQDALGKAKGIVLPQGIQLAEAFPPQTAEVRQDQPEELDVTDVPHELLPTARALQEIINRAPAAEKRLVAQQMQERLTKLVDEHRTKENAELKEEKAHLLHAAERARHHREMYATDADYRDKTNKIMGDSETRATEFDQRQEQLQGIAAKHGITTPHDDAVAEARAAYEEALRRREDDPEALLTAEAELHRRARLQAIALEQELRKRGQHSDADVIHGFAKEEDTAFDKAMEGYDKWSKAYLDARRRQLSLGGLSEEEEQQLEAEEGRLQKERERIIEKKSADEVVRKTGNNKKEAQNLIQETTQKSADRFIEATRSWLARDGLTVEEQHAVAELSRKLEAERLVALQSDKPEKAGAFITSYTKKAEDLALELGEPASRYEVKQADNAGKSHSAPVVVAVASTGSTRTL